LGLKLITLQQSNLLLNKFGAFFSALRGYIDILIANQLKKSKQQKTWVEAQTIHDKVRQEWEPFLKRLMGSQETVAWFQSTDPYYENSDLPIEEIAEIER
jgi:predicted nucleotide-binding protein (sugar kinase/HSP70/actin superfamily)